jgi:hypothetical protein
VEPGKSLENLITDKGQVSETESPKELEKEVLDMPIETNPLPPCSKHTKIDWPTGDPECPLQFMLEYMNGFECIDLPEFTEWYACIQSMSASKAKMEEFDKYLDKAKEYALKVGECIKNTNQSVIH